MNNDVPLTSDARDHVTGSVTNRSAFTIGLSLFLFLCCAYGTAINSSNLTAFQLQQAGVEAIVERKQFSLEGSAAPQLTFRVYYHRGRPFGDTFLYKGRQYAAKQPGQFMAGSVIYFFLHLLGLSYVNDYLLVSALVTFFTTSIATAAAGCAVFAAARELAGEDSVTWPLGVALAYGLGTPAFVYSGIAHHDQLSSSYLMIAFYLVLLLARRKVSGHIEKVIAGGAGLLLGLTLTTSVLPILMVIVIAIYLASLGKRKLIAAALIGALVGLAPMLIYNAAAFGNPLLLPNVAGGYQDTFLMLDPRKSLGHTSFYASALTLYAPVFWVGVVGVIFYPRELRREQLVLGILVASLAILVLNIETDGGCQYGPRYFLPAMPYACLGLIGFRYLRRSTLRLWGTVIVLLSAVASFLISLVGAVYGAMYCETEQYALWRYLSALTRGEWNSSPLTKWLIGPLIISLALLVLTTRRYARKQAFIY
ncbi:MAG TPA: hypothetical protein VJM12_07250 [Pyrinomonadaceae bacterium]|nr:hypothetical protein [Pyrinomonadaceae bacterium]